MLRLFPALADDLIDAEALPPTDKTELNYRTRPLSREQELRLTWLVLFGAPLLVVLLAVATHFVCLWWRKADDLLIAVGVVFGSWVGMRMLTGAVQRRDLVIGHLILVSCIGAMAWRLALLAGTSSVQIGLAVCWLTSCLIARQVAAWTLAGPTVDHDTMRQWQSQLPNLVPAHLSRLCPELLTFNLGSGLVALSWGLSLAMLHGLDVEFITWPLAFAASSHLVWIVWHLLAVVLIPCPNPVLSWRATWRAIVIFVTYDIHSTPAAGVFRFPTKWLRWIWNRWILLILTLSAIGFGFGVHCPSPATTWLQGGSLAAQLTVNVLMICLSGPLVLYCVLWLVAGTLLARFEQELSQHKHADNTDWDNYVDRILNSSDELERAHLLLGTSEPSDYPVLVHREIYDQHGHVLGDSGASKTALAMAPQATQIIARADSTVVIVDLKGDRALFESCRREASRTGKLRFRWISNEVGKSTFGFNPLLQSHNSLLSVEQLTQELLQGMSLDYGIHYGAGYFTAMNEIVLNNVLKETGARSFAELSRHLADRRWYSQIGHEDDWKQARHLGALVKRLGGSQAINVVPDMFADQPEVHRQAIDVTNLYEEPQVVYLWLRSAVEPTNAPAIARLFLWSMFTAASHQLNDRTRVYFFVDEMQQIISDGIKLIFEQFRDMGGTIIAAHQTAGQLRRQGTDLAETIDSCTAVKHVFRASDLRSLESLEALSGTQREEAATWYQQYERGTGDLVDRYEELHAVDGEVRVSEEERPRYDRNALLGISSRRQSSLVRFTFGSGYTQFAGRSIPIRSFYHVPWHVYLRRRRQPWPTAPGAFLIEPPQRKTREQVDSSSVPSEKIDSNDLSRRMEAVPYE